MSGFDYAKKPYKWVCEECGGDDIMVDATARWNVLSQEWELAGTMDCTTCEDCGKEVDIKPVYL